MLNKQAVELSLNFLVIFIITIVIFGFGISFISRLSSEATELQELTISELDEKIGNIVCEGSDRVCVGIDRKTIIRKNFDFFGLKILNVLDSQDFDIVVFPPSTELGFKKDKTPIAKTSPNLIVNPASRSVFIEKNEEKNVGIGIEVPANAIPGTYILNVEIKTSEGKSYSLVQKLYVDVP